MKNYLKIINKKIGVHIYDSFNNIINYILKLNIEAFSFFLGNPLKWKKNISNYLINKFVFNLNKFNINNNYIIPHSSYLINLGSPIKLNLWKSINLLKKEIDICNRLNIKLINFHLGSHLGIISENKCISNIIKSINYILDETSNVILVMENSAGQGNYIGYKLDHISVILKSIDNKKRIGVCIDTGHLFASGYDIRSFCLCEKFFNVFENIIGLKYLRAIHLNTSKFKFNSRQDKHSTLLNSKLGNNIFYWIMRENIFNNIPIILETIDSSLWKKEINWLYSL